MGPRGALVFNWVESLSIEKEIWAQSISTKKAIANEPVKDDKESISSPWFKNLQKQQVSTIRLRKFIRVAARWMVAGLVRPGANVAQLVSEKLLRISYSVAG